MKVSVIIPVYNVFKYIERCLLSVLNQTWEDMEVILVDDCTPDNSMEIAKQIIASHVRGKIVTCLALKKNRGQSAARNIGIRVATGDYLFFLDSDDYLNPNSLSILMEFGVFGKYDFILGNYELVGHPRAIPLLKLPTGPLESNDEIMAAYAHDMYPRTVWNMLVNRKLILDEELFFEEGIIHEDDLWTFLLACKAHFAYIVNEITYFYYMHFHSTTGNPSLWNLECRIHIIELMYDYILSSEKLKKNRYIYIIFEKAKIKYFDRILYFTSDEEFRYQSYQMFREKQYTSVMKALYNFHPSMKLLIGNLHYLFSPRAGYVYLKSFVRISYYLLVLPIKIKKVLHIK